MGCQALQAAGLEMSARFLLLSLKSVAETESVIDVRTIPRGGLRCSIRASCRAWRQIGADSSTTRCYLT
eukprot:scaffold110019_cov32-Tisochrysis_lutea.AAC.2